MIRSVRNTFLAAGAFWGLLALGGCGGGGGALNGVPPVAFTYPSSLANSTANDTVDGFMSPYKLNATTPSLVSVLPSVSGTTPSAGTIAISVAAIALSSTVSEPAFVVTFDPTSISGTVLTNSPLASCASCLKTVTAPAIVNGVATTTMVTFTYLDPTAASLTYSALGMWSKPTTVGSSDWPYVGGAFSAGVLTRGIDLPTTGTASYSGYFIGRYAASTSGALASSLPGPGTYLVGANAQADANFGGAGTVTFSTSGTMVTNEATSAVTAASGLNLASSTMTITRGLTSNSFTGSVGTQAGGLSGQIVGGFYGPPATTAPYAPPEMGGSLSVGDSTGTKNMAGSFALKK
jgi:hypothetical protein